jgi:hypothetical protein
LSDLKAYYIAQGMQQALVTRHRNSLTVPTQPYDAVSDLDDDEQAEDQHANERQPRHEFAPEASDARSRKSLGEGSLSVDDSSSSKRVGQQRPASYREREASAVLPPGKYVGAASSGGGGGGGGDGGSGSGRADLFIKIPQTEGSTSSMGRTFQQPRVEEEREEDSEGQGW